MEQFQDQKDDREDHPGHFLEHPQENGEESHPSTPKKISLEKASQESPFKPKSPTPKPGETKSAQKWWDVINDGEGTQLEKLCAFQHYAASASREELRDLVFFVLNTVSGKDHKYFQRAL
jgi:hypothetical protein